jgi:hypothetical protein
MKSIIAISQKVISKWNLFTKSDRGDVPGWVLVTVMTAGLVVAIWSVADTQLKAVLSNALRTISAP